MTHSPALLDLFLSSDASIGSAIVFPPLRNSDHVVVSVSMDFLSNSKQDPLFHCIACSYYYADRDSHHDHLRDVPWKVSLSSVLLLLLLVNFLTRCRLELMYISLIVSIRSSLTPLHGFQLLILLSWFIEITFFVCTNRINLPNLKESSGRVIIIAKGFLKLLNLYMLLNQESITSQKLGFQDFC